MKAARQKGRGKKRKKGRRGGLERYKEKIDKA
jgi:hypothetical protein